jgi:hypothetical protein
MLPNPGKTRKNMSSRVNFSSFGNFNDEDLAGVELAAESFAAILLSARDVMTRFVARVNPFWTSID